MAASLAFDEYLEAIALAGDVLLHNVQQAGLAAKVPTCPKWTAAHLLAHQAMVHRWATAHVANTDASAFANQTELRGRPDLPQYYVDGLEQLLGVLRSAPADLAAMTFLNDSGEPRLFWARRQAHETVVHAVDALSATLGRAPTTAETGVATTVAADGLDELLRGFYTRGRSKLFAGTSFHMAVAPSDSERCWRVCVDETLTVEPGDVAPRGDETVVLRGTAADLYLGLWNRGTSIEISGDAAIVQRWRTTQRIRWS